MFRFENIARGFSNDQRSMKEFVSLNKVFKLLKVIALCLILSGCYSTGPGSARLSQSSIHNSVYIENPALSLGDYLRRVPGVQVTGSGDERGSVLLEDPGQLFPGVRAGHPLHVLDGGRPLVARREPGPDSPHSTPG